MKVKALFPLVATFVACAIILAAGVITVVLPMVRSVGKLFIGG